MSDDAMSGYEYNAQEELDHDGEAYSPEDSAGLYLLLLLCRASFSYSFPVQQRIDASLLRQVKS